MNLRSLFTALLLLTLVGTVETALRAEDGQADKLKLLIVDGQNNHNWQAMTPVMKSDLERTGRFTVDVVTSPPGNAPREKWDAFHPEFSNYQVVLSNYNGQPWPDSVKSDLEKYVAGGGGLVIIHAANNSFPEWPEWNKMIGLGWRDNGYGDRVIFDAQGAVAKVAKGQGPGAGHGRQHEFVIDIRESDHPVLKGMPAHWMHAKDELYHGQRGPAENMHVLATAFSDKATGGTGDNEPMIWWIPYGKGKVFTTVMGHVGGNEIAAIRCVGFVSVMTRGCEWVATDKVTIPLPKDFPTAEKVSILESVK